MQLCNKIHYCRLRINHAGDCSHTQCPIYYDNLRQCEMAAGHNTENHVCLGLAWTNTNYKLNITVDNVSAYPAKISEYGHYFKDVSKYTHIDVYRVLELFGVTDPCVQHAVKKLLVAGGRGNKDMEKDIKEAIVSLQRWEQMRTEDFK